ncbi:amidase [Halalkalibacter krulwichiae]|uniref:amidase n=1 Tax=Halalkalibacter krulwichiae TaxID=199441 RepID=UPI0008267B77|nr:amidase [Halalkalibacter krulwichiae]
MNDTFHAFINEELEIEPISKGALSGRKFAVKDVFEVKGQVASAGNPDWLRTHKPSGIHAMVIQQLLHAGAKLKGMTITDELMYSLNGENYHYGTPRNPRAPGRIPGGSSSGSAVAVSAGLVDFALGTDTGGSVRVPAAYCGIYGIRPSHGAVPIDGVIPLAESFDTVGWFAQDSELLLRVGRQLIKQKHPTSSRPFSNLLFGTDAWDLVDIKSRSTLSVGINALLNTAERNEWVQIAEEGLMEWASCFRTLQGREIWNNHRKWINEVKPHFGPDIKERFEWASTLTETDQKKAEQQRIKVQSRLHELLGDDTLLIIPTTPGEAPFCQLSGEEIEKRRSQTMQLSCIAGLAGFPQVAIPLKNENGLPLSLSIIAGKKQDLRLLEWVYERRDIWASI